MIRCTILITVALALSSTALASEAVLRAVSYPRLPTSVRTAKEFVPSGWKLIAIETGDLGGGQGRDVAVLMKLMDPANVRPVRSPYYKTDDTNPYMLAVGFWRGDRFDLVGSNYSLFPREVAPMHGDDPPGPKTVEIHRGALTLTFGHLRGFDRLRFRWNAKALALIGYDCAGVAGGRFSSLSANYLTQKARTEEGDVSGNHSKVSTLAIRPGSRPTLDQIDWQSDWAGMDVRGNRLAC
jgi:hypothetical protein